jgi:phosphinothricin acetyltransferase
MIEFQLKPCTEAQLPEILAIFNDAILNSTALYEYKIRTLERMNAWYADKIKGDYPVVGAFAQDGKLLGFSTYGMFRVQPAYKYTVEHSVYVRIDMRGHGLGKVLLREIVKKAEEQNYHSLIGVIDADNTVSIKLHENEGFFLTGVLKEAGYKFGRWLDAAFYQLRLKTPEVPTEE